MANWVLTEVLKLGRNAAKDTGTAGYTYASDKIGRLPQTIYKNQPQMDHRHQCNKYNYKSLGRNMKVNIHDLD